MQKQGLSGSAINELEYLEYQALERQRAIELLNKLKAKEKQFKSVVSVENKCTITKYYK